MKHAINGTDEDLLAPESPVDEDDISPEQERDEDIDDDEVGTDERGKEMLRASAQDIQPPHVDSDRRVPATDAEPEGSLDHVETAPLKIQEIENLEDDAKGG
jgi:hypothetical protein